MSRIVLKSSNTAVVLGESPAFKTVDDSGSLFAGVRSASFGFSANRQKVKQLGSKELIVNDLIRQPDVDLSLSYTYSPTYANEDLLGLSFSLDEKSELTLLSTLKDKSYNVYFYNNPEQGEDGIQSIKENNYFPGGEIISFGNAFLSSYALDFQVGSIPEVSVSFNCSNVESEKYYGIKTKSPAINLNSGNNSGVGDFDITKTKIYESKFFDGILDLNRDKLPTPTPSEIDFNLQDIQIGGQKLSPNNHILNSFKFEMNIDRASYYKLGSSYACGREIKYPVNATVSLSSLVNSYENGFISGLVKGQDINFLDIVATDCSGIITSKLFFENLKIEQVRYEMLVNQSMNYSLDLSLQINDEEGFKSFVTEEDWKTTRVYDSGGSVLDFRFGDIPANYWSNQDNIYKVRFADFGSYEVGDRAFYDCDNLSGKLFITNSVNYIGNQAFESCDKLGSLFFDSNHSIQQIGASGFKDCTSINNDLLLLPYSLRTLSQSCFEGCSSIQGLSLGNVSNIGDKSFFSCSALRGPLTLPNELIYIGSSSFENCLNLDSSIEFPDSLGYVNEKAFKGCVSLDGDLEINNSISGIGPQAFYGCTGLNGSLTLSESLSYIEPETFYNCFSITGDLILPEGITGVGAYAFYNLGVDALYLPESLQYIYSGAFERLNDIKTDLQLPTNLKVIGARAFASCDSFSEYLEIPSGVESIGEAAFSGCIGIDDVYIDSPVSVFQGDSSFYGVGGCLFVTPKYYNDYIDQLVDGRFQGMPVCLGSKDTIVYDAQSFDVLKVKRGDIPSNWYSNQTLESILIIGSTCEKIQDNAFSDSVGLVRGVSFPSGLKFIGDNAFRNCSFSGDLIIQDATTGIGSSAFENCSGFNGNIQIPYYLDIINEKTFKNCFNLQSSLVIPSRVTRIEESAFENCSSLNGALSLPAQCEYIGDKAFDNCSLFSGSIILPSELTGIGAAAFRNCSGFNEQIEFSESIFSIGDSGFYNCSSISGILELPVDLEYLGEYAFYNCSGLSSELIIPNLLTGISLSTFENCSGLGPDLFLPATLSGIGERSFYNCGGFSGLISLTDICAQNIGVDALYGTSFNNLVVDESVEDISIGEFDYFKNYPMALTLQDGLLSVSNSGFKSYSFTGDFFLPGTVSFLGDSAFENITTFDGSYDFSESNVSNIGKRAFKNCSGISGSLIFNDSLLYLGDEAFRNNTSINGELSLSQELTGIGEYVFAGNSLMTGNLNIPDTVSGVGQYAFLNCSSLNGFIKLSSNQFLTEVSEGTFKNCSSITGDLIIPDNITNIELQAFKNCSGLSGTITLTDIAALSLIGKDALDQSDFQHLIISDFVDEVSNGEFDYFQNKDLSLTLSRNITGILDNSFDNYDITGSLILPSGLTEIGDNAFKSCGGLSSGLVLPESVVSLGDSAFEDCIGFSGDLTLPIGLPAIGARSFYNCVGLDGILTISDLTASSVTLLDEAFFGTNFYMLRAESVDGTISNVEFDVLASNFQGDLDIGLSVNLIDVDAFDNYGFLGGFYCSGFLSEISAKAFSGVQFSGDCKPESVIKIGNGAFADCGFDRNIFVSEGTEIIGNNAFLNCDSFKGDLILPETTISIGNRAFFNCTGFDGEFVLSQIEEDVLDLSLFTTVLNSVGSYAFVGCTGVSGNLIIPGSVTNIGEHAFEGMTSLNGYLYINASGITDINEAVFKDCSNLNSYLNELKIPRSVDFIGVDAFRNCSNLIGSLKLTKEAAKGVQTNAFLNTNFTNLTVLSGASIIENGDFDYFQTTGVSLTLNEDLENIGSGAFDNYSFVNGLDIPNLVTGIGDNAFKNNDGFSGSLSIPEEVLEVGSFAFSGCHSFDSLTFDNYEFHEVREIGSGAFKDCYGFNNNLVLGGRLQRIKSGAFQGCSNINGQIIIPEDVEEIGTNAFSGCTSADGVFIENLLPSIFEDYGTQNAFLGISGYLSLGVLVYNLYASLSTPIGGQLFYQGMPISGVGASESVFYTGFDDGTTNQSPNINLRGIQDSIDVVVEGQQYSIPDRWKSAPAATSRPPVSVYDLNKYDLNCWFELGALCESIGDDAFKFRRGLRGNLNLAGDLRIIGEEAFDNCSNITGLQLGNSLETVKRQAFRSCEGIRSSLSFKSNVTGIGDQAFYSCKNAIGVSFSEGLEEIGELAFSNCTGFLGDLEIPDSVDVLGNSAFYRCTNLTSLTLSNQLQNIPYRCFSNLKNITNINLPSNLNSLGTEAFKDCVKAEGNIEIPGALETIGVRAFNNCGLIQSISFPDPTSNPTNIGESAFDGCSSFSGQIDNGGTLDLPPSIVSNRGLVNPGAFKACVSIKKVTFPSNYSGINQIDNPSSAGVFEQCYGITGVSYGDGIDFITSRTFQNCLDLTGVDYTDSSSLTGIGGSAFQGCSSLPEIFIPENCIDIGNSAFKSCSLATSISYVPSGNLKRIGRFAFQGTLFPDLNLPNLPVQSGFYIDDGAYKDAGLDGEIFMPDSISGMGTGVFDSCYGITYYNWPTHVTSIPASTFKLCLGLTGISIPSWVTEVNNSAFDRCNLASGSINIHSGVDFIGSSAFLKCENVTSLQFNNNSILDIRANTFEKTYALSGTVVLNNIRTINSAAFRDSAVNDLTWNDIPEACYIKSNGLDRMTNLVSISLPTGLEEVGQFAMSSNSSLEFIDYSDTNLQVLGQYVHYQNTSLSGVDLDNNLIREIGRYCFQTTNLKNVSIPNTVDTIGDGAFNDCSNLENLTFENFNPQITRIPNSFAVSSFTSNSPNSISFPDTILSLGYYSFRYSNLSGIVDLSNTSLNAIAFNAFEGCNLISGIKYPSSFPGYKKSPIGFPSNGYGNNIHKNSSIVWVSGDNITEISTGTFLDCHSFSGFVDYSNGLPDTLKLICDDAFNGCLNIKPRQNFLISGNIEEIEDECFANQNSTQSLIIHESFSGSIGNSNWSNVDNLNRLDILFDNSNASIGNSNWSNDDLISDIYINCPYSVWGSSTNNFNNAMNATIRIKDTHFNDYINNNWSGQQGVNSQCSIVSYTP